MASSPPLQFCVRSKQGFEVYEGVPRPSAVEKLSCANAQGAEYSKDGRLLAVQFATGISIYDSFSYELIRTIERPGVVAMTLSPSGRYLLTWERIPDSSSAARDSPSVDPRASPPADVQQNGKAPSTGNLIVWSTSTGQIVASFAQRHYSKDLWPAIRWTADESVAARLVTNEVHVFKGKDMGAGVVGRIQWEKVAKFELSPGEAPYHVAACVPEIKGNPGAVRVYRVDKPSEPVLSKSFFKADRIDIKWNALGSAVLVVTQTDVDVSNKSYYGENNLFYLNLADGSQLNVPLEKEGPIHDVQWSPTGKDFIVIHGFMPARSVLFSAQCKPIYDLGSLPRNQCIWNPHARFVCVAGFGNLQGDMDFWDRTRTRRLGGAQSSCAISAQWSPDGRYLLTAVLFPRLRVDNDYKIFKYDGTLVHYQKINELYQVIWRPSLPSVYPDRPPSPRQAQSSVPDPIVPPAAAPPVRVGAYRHPNATASTPSLFQRPDDLGGKLKTAGEKKEPPKPKKELPPGYSASDEAASKAALKNKKKREKKKHKDGTTAATAGGDGHESPDEAEPTSTTPGPSAAASQSPIPPAAIPAAPTAPKANGAAPVTTPEPVVSVDELSKRLKAMNKKLRQVAEIKDKAASGKPLEADQQQKLAAERALVDEINAITRQLAKAQ